MARRFDRNRQFTVNDRLPYIADTHDAPVELTSLEVSVHVTGLFAETTQILRLHNPNHRDLEGNLIFPLPDGAAVCGYAIDVDGQLVDGVVVPKEEARRILEAEIRKGVDPGLVEQVQGNVYRTRIYPLPAGGDRTVKIVYISRLAVDHSDAAYHLPLGHAEGVDEVSLRVEVAQSPTEPAIVGGLGNLTLNNLESRWVAEAKLGEGRPAEDLLIRLPNLPDHLTAIESAGEDTFFCIASKQVAQTAEPWVPEDVGIVWDASGSRDNVEPDIAVLEALASRWPDTRFHVRVVRDATQEDRAFSDAAELVSYLRGIPYDGATNLAALDLTHLPTPTTQAWLFFSDGLATVGSGVPQTSVRVFTISGQARSDAALLRHLAQGSGGAHFDVLNTQPEVVAGRIADWSDSLRVERTAGCADVHVHVDHGRLTVVGRLTEDVASVLLAGPGAPADQLSVTRGTATSGRNLARAWAGAQSQLAKLLGDGEQAVQLGQKFGLVTPGTSLLVLETLEQYLEYDIEPPDTQPLLLSQFLDFRRTAEDDEQRRESQQLARVLSMWEQRVAWWETDFAAARKEKGRAKKIGMARDEENVVMRSRSMPPPASAPAPPPMRQAAPEPAMEASVEFDDDMELDEGADMLYEEQASGYGGGAPGASRGAAKADEGGAKGASIQIKPWSPDTPYLSRMRTAGAADAYATYLRERTDYAASPAFFLDCSDYLLTHDARAEGLRVLSNLLELALDDPPLLRMYAWRMQQEGELDPAIDVLQRVLDKRDDEPQSHRDLALALALRWERDGDVDDATRAMRLLYAVIRRDWDRFPEIELIALMELNRLIANASAAGVAVPEEIDQRFIKLLDLDVRISMSWDADLTDVDLHVFEPTGEHAYYGHNRTEIGGLVSRDFTQGYGPEEYVLRNAAPGEYVIKTHYYGSHQQTIAGACTVIVNVFTNYGRPNEKRQVLTLRLERASDQELVGSITIDGPGPSQDWQAKFRSLKKGMTVDEIVAVVGQPETLRGAETTVLVYRPRENVEIEVTTNPRLQTVQQLMNGATLDLI